MEVRGWVSNMDIPVRGLLTNFKILLWIGFMQNTLEKLTFSKVVSAKKQVVQGTIYHLTIEVQEAGNPKLYDAKVWVKPWENFKKLEDFKPAPTQAGFTTADLGVKKG
jgi:hypothetical protein